MSTTAAATGTATAIPAGSTEAPIPVRGPAAHPSVILRPKAEESVTPVFVRNRNTPSVTFGDSSLREGAKDEGYGFFGLRPQNDEGCGLRMTRGAAIE